MKLRLRKLVALALVFAMLATVLPMNAFAVNVGRGVEKGEQAQGLAPACPAISQTIPVDDELTVTVEAEEGAFPAGTAVTAEKVALENVQKAVDDTENVDGTVLYAVDITFTKDGAELQPAEGKKVKVSFSAPDLSSKASVVHIDSETNEAKKIDTVETDEPDEVAFEADKFSVYAVIDNQYSADPRLKVVFKNGNNEIDTIYVKESDLGDPTNYEQYPDYLNQIVYDPGVPEGAETGNKIFAGWIKDKQAYTLDDKDDGMDIDSVRAVVRAAVNDGISTDETLTFYAMLFTVYRVYFQDENGVTFDTDTYYVTEGASQTITVNKPYTVSDPTQGLIGWKRVVDGQTTGDPIKNGSTITITGDVILKAEVGPGHWLSFDENDAGTGGSFTPPVFYAADEETVRPAKDPTRPGYDFVAWHVGPRPDPYGSTPTGAVYEFNQTLGDDLVLYAEWAPRTEATYKIVVWTQSVTDDVNATEKHYDYFKDVKIEGVAPGTQIPQSVITQYTTIDQYSDQDEYEAYLEYFDALAVKSKDDPEKNRNRPFKFSHYEITNGVGEGDSVSGRNDTVVNVYYDREVFVVAHVSKTNFTGATKMPSQTKGVEFVNNPASPGSDRAFYGIENGQYISVTSSKLENNRYSFKKSNGETYLGPIFRYYTNSYTLPTKVYYVKIQTGLYGQSITWPTPPNDLRWNNISYLDSFDGNLFGAINLGNQANVISTSTASIGDLNVHYWVEAVPESLDSEKTYSKRADISYTKSSNQFNVTSRIYGGELKAYNGDSTSASFPTSWTEKTDSGYVDVSGNHLHVKYDLVRNNIKFAYEGVTLDDYEIENIPFGYSLEEFEKLAPTSDAEAIQELIPDPNGYYFAGWYEDPLYTKEMDWSGTMPAATKTVYAKIAEKQYHFHADLSDGTTLPNDQWNSFVVPYRTKIEGVNFMNANPPAGMTNVSLVGWFLTDEDGNVDFSRPYNFDMIQITDNELSLSYADYPEARDDFYDWHDTAHVSNDLNNPDVQGVVWIKPVWRDNSILQSGGIHIRYLYADETFYANDSLAYADMSEVYAMHAPAKGNLPAGKHFKYWKLATDDTVQFYPSETFYVTKPTGTGSAVKAVDEDGELWVTFVAVLEDDEKKTPTHIYWFPNTKDMDGSAITSELSYKAPAILDEDVLDENQQIITAGLGVVVKDVNLWINDNVRIPAYDTYSYPGYEFKGWTRVNAGTVPGANPTLFLKWVPAEGTTEAHYEAQDKNEHWVTVEYVAADEILPYHDLYAVWEKLPSFTVYYSSEPTKAYNLLIKDYPSGINLKDGAADVLPGVHDGYYYGGYYTEAPANWTSGDPEQYVWNSGKAGLTDNPGTAMKPVENGVYYVKEVDASKYLKLYYKYTYVKKTKRLTGLWVMTCLDDLRYSDTGFVVFDTRLGESAYAAGDKTTHVGNAYKTITVKAVEPAGSTTTPQQITVKPKDVCGGQDVNTEKARLTYCPLTNIYGNDFAQISQKDPEVRGKAQFSIVPYWVTKDGVTVYAKNCRTYYVHVDEYAPAARSGDIAYKNS